MGGGGGGGVKRGTIQDGKVKAQGGWGEDTWCDLHSLQRLPCMFGREDLRTYIYNRAMLPSLTNNAAAVYQGPVKIELFKGVGLQRHPSHFAVAFQACKASVSSPYRAPIFSVTLNNHKTFASMEMVK